MNWHRSPLPNVISGSVTSSASRSTSTSTQVSSATSRASAAAGCSSGSTMPDGRLHRPLSLRSVQQDVRAWRIEVVAQDDRGHPRKQQPALAVRAAQVEHVIGVGTALRLGDSGRPSGSLHALAEVCRRTAEGTLSWWRAQSGSRPIGP